MKFNEKLHELREDYRLASLNREDLDPSPFMQFKNWFKQAESSEVLEPNAFILSTVHISGMPSSRTVLLKELIDTGYIFYTNYDSQKAREIQSNSQVAMIFLWKELQRQVRIQGTAKIHSHEKSEKYFKSRPRASQLGAWASIQSQELQSRKELETAFELAKEKFSGKEINMPPFWGGYEIIPHEFEFWQGRTSRLHDRFSYRLEENAWKVLRKYP